ncbi:XRE family transcriptional regulator [Lacticaseibacillus zeae DSM 20178 = KCTC 3804]|uniref:XRE family transcriptional regulator n=8 Tax=Lacticaseibacillus TaxID=2759736 RepID=A0A0R1ELH6_LACZE|nr:XRE family transcriptional regulator [Lacticaseibacillus zeae DSM 20178 = KCTC 3804]
MMLDNIGKLVHQQRRSLNLTIEKLAERSGVSVSLISRMERGDVNNISVKKLTDIAQALDMEVGDFFIAPEMSDINTLALVKYLTGLPETERARVSEVLMQVINL